MAERTGSVGAVGSASPGGRRPAKFFHVLLALLGLLFLLQPLWTRPVLGIEVGTALVSLILIGGTLAVTQHRFAAWVAGLLALAGLLVTFWPDPFDLQRALKDVSLAGFCMLVAVLLLVDLFGRRSVDGGSLSAALCAYLLIGLTFSAIYDLADWSRPNAFDGLAVATAPATSPAHAPGIAGPDGAGVDGPPAPAEPVSLNAQQSLAFLYFSFVTLTTVGYGDIHPVAPFARMLAVLEALIGQIILVVLVARLVGLHVAGAQAARGDGTP